MTSRRYALVRLTGQAFVDLCKAGPPRRLSVVAHALPNDATFVRAGHDVSGDLLLVVESADFAAVPDSERLPELPSTVFREGG